MGNVGSNEYMTEPAKASRIGRKSLGYSDTRTAYVGTTIFGAGNRQPSEGYALTLL